MRRTALHSAVDYARKLERERDELVAKLKLANATIKALTKTKKPLTASDIDRKMLGWIK